MTEQGKVLIMHKLDNIIRILKMSTAEGNQPPEARNQTNNHAETLKTTTLNNKKRR